MSFAMLLFAKAKPEQLSLFDARVDVHGYSTKRGTYVAPHQARRKKKAQVSKPDDSRQMSLLFDAPKKEAGESADQRRAKFRAHIDELKAKREASYKERDRVAAEYGETVQGLELRHQSRDDWVVLMPDPSAPGKWRHQSYDADGIKGHAEFDTAEAALRDVWNAGYRVKDQGAMDRLAGTDRWKRGMEIAYERQHGKEDAFVPTHELSDGTKVRQYVDDDGAPEPDTWEDRDGNIIEDDSATEINTQPRGESAKPGDTKVEDGVTYVLTGDPPRWHRADALDSWKESSFDAAVDRLAGDGPFTLDELMQHWSGSREEALDHLYARDDFAMDGDRWTTMERYLSGNALERLHAVRDRLADAKGVERDKLRTQAEALQRELAKSPLSSEEQERYKRWLSGQHEAAAELVELAEREAAAPEGDRAKAAERMRREFDHKWMARYFADRGGLGDQPADDADLDPNSPTYIYRDTGHIPGARKELAADQIRNAGRRGEQLRSNEIDWDAIEENAREARELVTKSNLFGTVDWDGLRGQGMEPGAGFLVAKVYAAIPRAPEDKPQARQDYAYALESLRKRMEGEAKTANDVTRILDEIREERDGVILNEEESQAIAAAKTELDKAWKEWEVERAEEKELTNAFTRALNEERSLSYEREKRKRGNWQPDPDLDARHSAATAEQEKALKRLMEWRENHPKMEDGQSIARRIKSQQEYMEHYKEGSEAMEQGRARIKGLGEELEKFLARYKEHAAKHGTPPKDRYRDAANRKYLIIEGAKIRNVVENPVTRAWLSLGERFSKVLDYRRDSKGSQAFAKHVMTAKARHIKDWSWLETGQTGAKAPTGRSVKFQLEVADSHERKGGRELAADTTASLKDHFGLREVQSGNWVLEDPTSARFHVESCAAGFQDLADILGVDDKTVSFNGRLGMAFGARGRGRLTGLAHYEPVHRVINITKMGGGGSLAHEWFHFIDNIVSEAMTGMAGSADEFATAGRGGRLPSGPLRDAAQSLVAAMTDGEHRDNAVIKYSEYEADWARRNMESHAGRNSRWGLAIRTSKSVTEAVAKIDAMYRDGKLGKVGSKRAKQQQELMVKIAAITLGANAERKVMFGRGDAMSRFRMASRRMDAMDGRKVPYWATTHEMAARAFSAYVQDRLEEKGRRNTYLVDKSDNAVYAALGMPHEPFPDGEERERINAAFDALWAAIRKDNVLEKAMALLGVA